MKLLFLFLFSVYASELLAASCCVSNTSISNLMILPSKWQQTISYTRGRVAGDVDPKGHSTFRSKQNKDVSDTGRLDLAYAWTERYQSGVSMKYQGRSRDLNGTTSSDSGWSDVGLSHAYRPKGMDRLWVFQTLNLPTASSVYDSNAAMAVDARGTGTVQSSVGIFGIHNWKEWDFIYGPEVHHSFARTFRRNGSTTEVGSFWGTSMVIGAGYIPWRSKARFGVAITPRLEGAKDVTVDGDRAAGKDSMVWDSSLNFTYTINAQYAIGANYTDQTFMGPAHNTLLNRSFGVQFQSRWF